MDLNVQDIAQLFNTPCTDNSLITDVSTDTRTLQAGALFVALRGANFDGHDHLKHAEEKGAIACLVEKADPAIHLPQFVVSDTIAALGELAHFYRKHFNIPMIAITGSNGKTTCKTLLAAILKRHVGAEHCLSPEKNYNNHIGLPLTLLKLRAEHQVAILELGTNAPGEIANLTSICQPTHALLTNANPSHTEKLGTVDDVATEKSCIYQQLKSDGMAFIPFDSPYTEQWHSSVPHSVPIHTFGLQPAADTHITVVSSSATGQELLVNNEFTVYLPLAGQHNADNAAAVISIALSLNVPAATIQEALKNVENAEKRLQVKRARNGATLLDDSYNANPASTRAAIETLGLYQGRKIAVLGDMRELGQKAADYHTEISEYARANGVDQLFTLGKLSQHSHSAFGKNSQHFENHAKLTVALNETLKPDDIVLFKGSNSMKMWEIIEKFEEKKE